MKKIIVLIALMAMTVAQAQQGRKGDQGEKKKDVTPQEMATVQSKKLTLALDLSDQQEKEVYQVLFKQAEKREANKISREDREKLSDDQKKEARLKMLDEKIAVKRNMKKILNNDQYAEWEKMMQQRAKKRGKGDKKRRNRD
ncbi:hypothetical protein [Nonlabens ulvanivorans]|uniref:hypothetical protein n=1 Tax=Nonlabens ulvanivorans TaxID=906888 RepID=UPI00294310D2|nr:hypothetical protein [Nonlabens ulvanivorans]WOI23041.1 hypothetical protein R1T42_01075 [Nonlabens ulvanivorans]